MILDRIDNRFRHIANQDGDIERLIELICAESPELLICGHIPPAAAQTVQRSGIDVRIGPCSVPATTLISRAHTLPRPIPTLFPQ